MGEEKKVVFIKLDSNEDTKLKQRQPDEKISKPSDLPDSPNLKVDNLNRSEATEQREVWENGTEASHYKIDSHVGKGGYGEVYVVSDINTNMKYAMKVEPLNQKKKGLLTEIEFAERIGKSKFFPVVYEHGEARESLFLIMELLGPSLSCLRRQLDRRRFSKFTSLFLAYHTFKCIEELHKNGYVHRDIKPGNFLLRPSWKNPVCLIDFGLAKPYIDFNTGNLLPEKAHPGFSGTNKYASLNAHEGKDQSRRDDLTSWFYSVFEFYNSRLLWPASRDREETYQKKKAVETEDLLKRLPRFFAKIYYHIESLKFEDCPDYKTIKRILKKHLHRHIGEAPFDWEKLSPDTVESISNVPLYPSYSKNDEDIISAITEESSKGSEEEDNENAEKFSLITNDNAEDDLAEIPVIAFSSERQEGGCTPVDGGCVGCIIA